MAGGSAGQDDVLALDWPHTTMAEQLGGVARAARRILVGLLGRGIQLSRTPAMHEAEGRAQGLSYVYRCSIPTRWARRAPPLRELIAFAEHFGFTGFNVTFPYKQEIIPLLDELSEAARERSARSTPSCCSDGRRIGHNTDMWGFKESFRRGHGRRERASGAAARRRRRRRCGGPCACWKAASRQLLVSDVQSDRAAALAARLRVALRRRAAGRGRIRPRRGRSSRRRHRQRDAGRHGKAAGHADRRRRCCGPSAGSPTSSISRSRRNCSARRAGAAAAR